ncbi:MAG: shufflon system plasmid conjugative transfer pilus tip adhesin PilV [Gammaproteobacteria bacterium]|nr:shufflon system plasmid conjugative transfer pilus tip adhesin PilV [Gammaproteobacteria bacterium]
MRQAVRPWWIRRRGVGLADITLALVIISILITGGVRLAADFISRQAVQRAAGQLSRLADDVETWAGAEYTTPQPRVAATGNGVEEHAWATLIAAGDVSEDAVPATALRQAVRVFLHAPDPGNLYVVLLTEAPAGGTVRHVPRPDRSARLVGRVDAHAPTELRGWSYSHDITDIITETADDFIGELGVIRQISDALHVSPYLHRVAVPGRPELNRVEATIDMNGHDIVDSGTVTAATAAIDGDLTIAGALTADTVTVDDTLLVNETLTADEADVDEVTAHSITATDLTAPSAAITRATADILSVAGTADITTLVVGSSLTVGSLVLEAVSLDHLDASTLTADEIITDVLATGSCAGC